MQDGKQCIRPHGTSTCQELARTQFKHWRDMKVFHVTRCWLTLPPKPGHAHEFTELGYQTFNPRSQPAQADWMIELAGEVRPTDYALIWKLVNIRSNVFSVKFGTLGDGKTA